MLVASSQYGLAGVIRWTSGGTIWRTMYTGRGTPILGQPFHFHDIAHPIRRIAVVACDSGKIIRTADYGVTWTMMDIGSTENLLTIVMTDSLHGMVASTRSLWRTDDGGSSWQQVETSPSAFVITELAMPDTSHYILMMTNSPRKYIMRTTDQGVTWQSGDTIADVLAMDFVDPNNGWACGVDYFDDGTSRARDLIYNTTDGGMTWAVQLRDTIEYPYGLLAIDFVDKENGIAVGREGKILRTANGGKTWQVEKSGLSKDNIQSFIAVEFPTNRRAYVVSSSGHFFRKGDGTDNGWSGVPVTAEKKGWTCRLVSNVIEPGRTIEVEVCSEREQPIAIQLVDLLGVERVSSEEIHGGCREQRLPTEGLSSGLYFLVVRGNREMTTIPVQVR